MIIVQPKTSSGAVAYSPSGSFTSLLPAPQQTSNTNSPVSSGSFTSLLPAPKQTSNTNSPVSTFFGNIKALPITIGNGLFGSNFNRLIATPPPAIQNRVF